jgi:hypothetical protein
MCNVPLPLTLGEKTGSTINVGVFAQKRAKKMHAGSFIHYP